MTLPVLSGRGGDLQVPDPDTGEVLAIRDASDRALATAAREIADLDRQLYEAKRALASELRDRHGVGVAYAGGHAFTVKEEQSWPAGATKDALARLIERGEITQADADRAMPAKPAPDKRAIKALISRLAAKWSMDQERRRVAIPHADLCIDGGILARGWRRRLSLRWPRARFGDFRSSHRPRLVDSGLSREARSGAWDDQLPQP
jgi:hypothetical protein